LNSVVSLYYYARILKAMWLDKPKEIKEGRLSVYHAVGIVGLAIPTVVMGIYFGPVIEFAAQSLSHIL
ncbi:MAG: NADH-quinone oxidoreductase subunit N, partial [Deltaproteobacteria bacterium]|nr:NADH-quinone oxidoreductase subunit N [Deltaproteobacteria bacterium]